MRKGEIARYEQFLLFPQCFQKLSVVDTSKLVSEGIERVQIRFGGGGGKTTTEIAKVLSSLWYLVHLSTMVTLS